jgi:hypothetical protein
MGRAGTVHDKHAPIRVLEDGGINMQPHPLTQIASGTRKILKRPRPNHLSGPLVGDPKDDPTTALIG